MNCNRAANLALEPSCLDTAYLTGGTITNGVAGPDSLRVCMMGSWLIRHLLPRESPNPPCWLHPHSAVNPTPSIFYVPWHQTLSTDFYPHQCCSDLVDWPPSYRIITCIPLKLSITLVNKYAALWYSPGRCLLWYQLRVSSSLSPVKLNPPLPNTTPVCSTPFPESQVSRTWLLLSLAAAKLCTIRSASSSDVYCWVWAAAKCCCQLQSLRKRCLNHSTKISLIGSKHAHASAICAAPLCWHIHSNIWFSLSACTSHCTSVCGKFVSLGLRCICTLIVRALLPFAELIRLFLQLFFLTLLSTHRFIPLLFCHTNLLLNSLTSSIVRKRPSVYLSLPNKLVHSRWIFLCFF